MKRPTTNLMRLDSDTTYEQVLNFFSTVNTFEKKEMGGREYLVAPATMIVPGVLNGSQGPLYYPRTEIEKNVAAWNMMPLTLGHPVSDEGTAVSARHPDVLQKYALGFVFNARTVGGKLKAEAWFDIERTRVLSPRILERLETGQSIELSTGLFTDNYPTRNKSFQGRPYDAVARNYRPDHLAILPNEKGACSREDGCGIAVNKKKTSSGGSVSSFNKSKVFKPKCPFAGKI